MHLKDTFNTRVTCDCFPRWRHQMETFSALLTFCAEHSPGTGEYPHKGQWRGALMFFSICIWIIGWVNAGEADDLRRHRAHYDVTVVFIMTTGALVFLFVLMCQTIPHRHVNIIKSRCVQSCKFFYRVKMLTYIFKDSFKLFMWPMVNV